MRKKLEEPKIEEAILKILEGTRRYLSVDIITKYLKVKYKINRSPQVIKRYLEKLESEGKIIRQKYG